MAEYVKAGRLWSAGRNVRRGLSRADVEALACAVYPWWDHLEDEDSLDHSAERQAHLGVNHTRLNQLAVRGFVPFERKLSDSLRQWMSSIGPGQRGQ